MSARRVVVVGAGIGGLAAALDLSRQGCRVTVLERAAGAGGKLREVDAGGAPVDAGPTVFTMRWIFEDLFRDAGIELAERLKLRPASVLARHYWTSGGTLDLYADSERTAQAIEQFAGAADAQGYREFCARTRDIYATLRVPFIASPRPSPLDLVRRVGWGRVGALWRTAPLQTMWAALGSHFGDPRLRQLFGRYATYCGSSPFLAPATLMLVAHVEQDGVWTVEGGMRRIVDALTEVAAARGCELRYGRHVARIETRAGRASAVVMADGERLEADAVVYNGDVSALATGLLGADVSAATLATPVAARSLSALTWCTRARVAGAALTHHNVFFTDDYAAEFTNIFARGSISPTPTVYVCAQDRRADEGGAGGAAERLLLLINAPAVGDRAPLDAAQVADCARSVERVLGACGVSLAHEPGACVATTPTGFDALFPGTGGALYGRANHGPFGSFARPGARTRVGGLYVAGGSAHPGPGVPMAAMSGRLAAAALLADLDR